ncbi:MAG TPA: ATP-binding protein, partial [Burkholderiales bacterium]
LPVDLPGVEEHIRRTMAARTDYAREFRVVWPDGSLHWMSARARYDYAPDGSCRRMLGVMADVTELKEAERQARELNARLAELLAERTRLAETQAAHLRELAVELTQAEQRERERLYELLHDEVQPLLVGARLKLSGLDERSKIETWVGSTAEVRNHITAALDTARSLSLELNPPLLRKEGLGAALGWLGRWVKTHHALEVHLDCDADAEPADGAARLLLFKAVRELLLNVTKHARTDTVSVVMKPIPRRMMQITVADKGAGFDAAARARRLDAQTGSGLHDIERRLGMIGGRIEITSKPGSGTTIRLSAPLAIRPSRAEAAPKPVTRRVDPGSAGRGRDEATSPGDTSEKPE